MYSLNLDPSTGILTAKVVGFMTPDEAAEYAAALTSAAESASRTRGCLSLLVDVSEMMLQPRTATDELEGLKSAIIRSPEDRIAMVTSSSLLKLQINRVSGSEQIAFYPTEAAAREWLLRR